MPSDGLVREETIEQVSRDLLHIGRVQAARRLRAVEPELSYAVTRAAVDVSSLFDDASNQQDLPSLVYAAVDRALLVLIESLRREHYRLWAETVIGTRLAQIDPDLPRRSMKIERDEPQPGEQQSPSSEP